MFYEKNSDLYGSLSNSAVNNAIYLMSFVNNYEEQKGKVIEQTKINFVVALS